MAVKKRTLGDDLRDFKAGKAPDGYRDNIKNTTPFAIKNWQRSDGFVGGEGAADNPIYGEVTTSSQNNKTKGVNSFLNSGNQMVNSVQKDFQYNEYREYENKYKDYNYEQLKKSYQTATDGREKEWILNKIKKNSSSAELQDWYDTVSKEYDSKLQQNPDPKLSKEFEDKASEYEELIKDKQHQETVQKNQKKNELYEDYYNDYDYKHLKEASENSRLSDYERAWLENTSYKKALSDDLQTSYDNNEKTMKEIREQKKSVLEKQNNTSSNEEKQSYIREAGKLDEQYDSLYSKNQTIKNQLEKKKYEEKKKAEYDDVIENDIKAKTVMQKYYNLQKFDEVNQDIANNGNGATSLINVKSIKQAVDYAKKISPEEREKIINDFNSLENKDTLYKYYKREREEQETAEQNQILTEYSDKHPVLGSIASVGYNTFGSIEDTVKYAGAGIDKAFGGDGYINPNSTNVAKAQTIREKVSEDMDGLGKFFYNTTMSIGDNLARMPLLALPGGEAMSLALAGTSAGVSSANDVINSGGSIESALWTGAAAGTAEVVFEKIPLDNLIKLKNEGTESVFRAVVNQMKTEGMEEGFTDIANAITDQIINGDMSQLALQYQNYIAQGYSEEEARKQIAVDFGIQIGQSFAAGAISGGVMSGGTIAINKISKKKTVSQLGRDAMSREDFDVNELIEEGKKSGNPKAENLARSLEKVVKEKGAGKVSHVDVGNLIVLCTEDKPTDNFTIENVDKQNIIDQNFELNGKRKTSKTSNNSEVKYTDTKAFGESYPHGIAVKTRSGGRLNIVGIQSSAKDFGVEDNNVILLADNGNLINADDVIASVPHFNQLFDYAKNFDTIGARVYLSQYEDYEKRSKSRGKTADISEYSECFERLYSYGVKGVTYDSIKKSGNFTREINILSAGVAYSAVQSGNNDIKVDTRDKSNKSQKIRMPGESNSISSKVYVDPGSEDSVKVTDEQLAILQAVAEKTGREIVLTDRMGERTGDENANGGYNPNDGKIYINAEVHDSYMLSVSLHEAVHGVAADNPAEYHALCTFITNYLVAKGENIDNLLDDIKIKWGNSVRSEDAALEELVCQTVMAIATDEAAIKTALSLEENKGILKKVASALKKIAKAAYDFIKGVGIQAHNKQAQPWIDNIEALNELAVRLEKAFESTRKLNEQRANAAESTETAQKNNTQSDVKFSYGGPKSKTANISLLDQAIEMENSGKDSESIRKRTGWFRGMEGMWRFEIDDRKMRFYKATKQDIKNIEEYKNNKIRYNGLSRKIANNTATAEQQQRFKEAEEYIKEYETSKKLSDYVSHPELFRAYPQLKEVNFYFDTISAKGAYYPDSNAIVINPTLSQAEQRESVIHEIQHAIQHIEGFADGSTMAQWQKNGADSLTAYNNYINTAGEIEARDTANRVNLNSEQRKNTRPDIDRKDVVFAEKSTESYDYLGKTDKGESIYKTNYNIGTEKSVKRNDIVNIIQNVWHKNPINLTIIDNGEEKTITAKFNPTLTPRSDLSKIAFGNRKGTASEQRMTLDLSTDLYQIAEESKYVRSKNETGKDNPAHKDVKRWHYFITDLIYRDNEGNDIKCYMNIDVKETNDGYWFYSFAIEKGTAPQTLLAVVTDESATVPKDKISQNNNNVKHSVDDSIDNKYIEAVKNNDLETAQKFVDEAAKKAGYDSPVLYHGTKSFGFTEFDLSKMDDGKSIFLTNSKEIASTYSGVEDETRILKETGNNLEKQGNYSLYAKLGKTFIVDAKGQSYNYIKYYEDLPDELKKFYPGGLWRIGTTRDVAEYAKDNGYDSVIFKGLKDNGGQNEKIGFDTEADIYVVFNPNDVKSADPITYDDNGNVIPLLKRFKDEKKDIRYSVDDVIDENRDLVAVHNLSAKKLAKMISDFDGQGIPAPSIAIDKADNVHGDFGEISLIFDRKTIDPKADRRNSVYSRDAWTSMYPKTEFKLNEKAMKKLAERLDLSVNELKTNMFDTSDIQKIKYRFEDDIKVRKAFLKENNIKVTPVLRDRQPDIMMFSARAVKKFVRNNDCTFDRLVNDKELRNELFKAYSDGASLKGIANAHIKETDEILDLAKSEEFYSVLKEKFDYAIEYAKGNVQQTEGSMTEAVNNAIEEYKEEFDSYIDELLSSGVLSEEYIVRDDVDPYDEYGNRKPFSKTHYKYNIENVVKAMKSGRSKVGSSFTGGISYVKSIGAKKLNSIDEIKGNKNKIVPMTEEELEAENERISDLIKPLIEEVAASGSYNNDFITASNNIVDAFNSKNDVNGVYNYLKQYHNKIKMNTVKKLFAAKTEIENLPTRYFEAKPHRAVGFDEVKAAVIPSDTHEALKGALKELGVPMYEYDSNNENSRAEVTQKAINTEYVDKNGEKRSDLRFSKDDTIDSDDKKITVGMSDSERAEILKNTVLTLADYEDAKNKVGKTVDTSTVISLQDTVRNNAFKILRVLGNKFKVFEKIYKNENVDLEFDYSKGTLKESVNKQGNISTDYSDFAKMLCVFDEIVNNAVPIEVHKDRYAGTERHNPDLKYDYVLLSGFKDKEYIVPVELHIKEYFKREPNKLYVSITLGKTKIEDNVLAVTTESEKDSVRNTARLSSKVSLPQLIAKINIPYGNFYKYIPDELLNENQLALKAKSLQDEEKKLSDLRKKNIPDSGISEIKLAVDDTINDGMFADGDLFDDDGYIQQSVFERAVKDNPDFALAAVYNHAAKTAETAIKQSSDVKLDDKAYLLAARRLMARYDISRKLNKDFDEELAQTIRKHIERMEKGVADFAGELELLVDECKNYLMFSGWLDEESMKSEREDILGYLSGKTLVIPEYAESDVKWEYDTIRRYRNKMFGKVNVALERNNPQGNIIYINDVIAFVEERYMSLINEDADEISGFKWLDNLVNNVLQPRFVNHYAEGYGENIDTAAIEMAFDVTTEIINAKAKYAVADSKTERKYIRKIAIAKEQAAAEQRALLKAKVESYSDKANEERSKRIKMIENLRRRMSEITDKSDKQRLKYEAQIDKLKSSLDAKTIILNMGYETIRDQYNENRTKTVYREKLGRMLDRMTKKLDGKANNNEYIPEVLKKPILDVLSSFTADPGTYKNGKKKSLPGYYGEWKNIAKIGDRVNELTIAYESLKSKDDSKEKKYSFIDVNSIAFREGTLEVLKYLSENLNGKNIYDLSADDLIDIYDAMQELDNSLRSAVEIILDGQKMSVQEAANRAISETESVNYKKDVQRFSNTAVNVAASTFRTIKNKAFATQLDPVRYGRKLSGYHDDYVISQVMRELHEGDKKHTRIMQECFVRVQAVTSKYSKSEIKGLQRDDVTEFNFKEQKTGKRVKVSQGMLLAIYLTDRQADGHRHLANENFNHYTVIPDLDMMNLGRDGMNKSHKVRFSEADLRAIKQYVENNKMLSELAGAISEVYNTILNQYINEVSMAKYGKLIATVKNYYPLWVYSDGAHYEKNFEAEFNDIRMRSRRHTKHRTKSYAPIVINDVLKTFTNSVQSVSEYCGLLIPIENFKSIYNSGNGDVTLHEAIKEKFGESAEHYIEKLMADLQNAPEILDNTWLQKAQGNFMGAKLLLNPGAAIKQLAAFPTAFNYFGVKNVTAAAAVGMTKIDFDLYAKYTPYLWYRKNGNGTVIGELSREMGFYKKSMDRIDIMGKMDRYVVGCLLYAAELHVEQTTDLKRGTDAFYKEVVRQFEKCIDETQPNNMITSKPQFIRNNVMKLLSLNAFKSQNMAIANCIIDSYGEFAARKAEYKESKTEEAKAAKNEAAKKFAGSVIGAVCSSVLIGVLTVAVNLLIWHKWDDFKDEEGNVTPLTILLNFIDYSLESLAGCFVWADKAYEAIKARIGLGKFFGFEVMSVETLNDIISNLTKGKILDFAANIADWFGLPMENGLRILRSIFSYANDICNGRGEIITENNSLIWENNTSYFNFIIVEAKQKGETEKAEHFEQMWKDDLINNQGKTEKQANDTIKTKLVTALAVSDDDVEQAALAKANGDLKSYEEHMNKVVAYGFDSVDVKKAVDRVIKNVADDVKNRGLEEKSDIINDLKNQGFNDKGAEYVYKSIQNGESSESEEEMSAFSDTSEGEGVAYTYFDAFEYLKDGDRENYERIEQYLIDNNDKTKKDVQSAMRSASRTDELWKAYFEAQGTLSGGGDPVKLEEYKKILTNIYGSWSTAVTYGRKYQKRMQEKERQKNK